MANGKTKKTDTFFDSEDNQVASIEDIGAAYKLICEFEELPLKPMTDAQAGAIVMTVHGDGKDIHVKKARLDALSNAEPTTETHKDAADKPVTAKPAGLKALSATTPERTLAIDLGRKVGPDMVKAWDKAIDGKDDWEGGPILLEPMVEKAWGLEVIRNMPEPDSGTKKWKETHPGANGPFDHYEANAVGGKIKSSFFEDIFDATSIGERIATRKAQLEAVVKNQTHLEGTPQAYLDAHPDEKALGVFGGTLTSKRSNYVRKLRMTILLIQKRLVIADSLPLVKVMFVNEKLNKPFTTSDREIVSKLKLPFVLFDPASAEKTKAFGLGTFYKFNVDEAKEKGGSVADLWSTNKREPKVKGDTNATGATGHSKEGLDIKVTNVREFESATSALDDYFANDALMGVLHQNVMKKSAESLALLENITSLAGRFEGLRVKYQGIQAELTNDRHPKKAA